MPIIMLYFILISIAAYCIISIIVAKSRKTIYYAFASSPHGERTCTAVKMNRNEEVFTEGDKVVDMSELTPYIIKGNSLVQEGLPDGVVVYVSTKIPTFDKLGGYFAILKIDNERVQKEHPEITDTVNGYKARKVKTVFARSMDKSSFSARMLEIDNSIAECIDRLWDKYCFAVNFYDKDQHILVSVTYKNGVSKDYSFHSLKNIEGVVIYSNEI